MYTFAERLAWIAGIVLPIGETIRRWGTLWVYPPAYLDDVVIGAFFLVGAWMSRRERRTGQAYLAAAYGFAFGIGGMSLADSYIHIQQQDISGASGAIAVAVKLLMMVVASFGLAGALGGPSPADVAAPVRTNTFVN